MRMQEDASAGCDILWSIGKLIPPAVCRLSNSAQIRQFDHRAFALRGGSLCRVACADRLAVCALHAFFRCVLALLIEIFCGGSRSTSLFGIVFQPLSADRGRLLLFHAR
jgi:hypothetical protein